jgi:putative protease
MPDKKEKLVGEITHYFGNIGVAVIKASDKIKVGDTIHVIGGDADFTQEVDSMEVDHQKVKEAKKGAEFGLKIDQKVREGYQVYKP